MPEAARSNPELAQALLDLSSEVEFAPSRPRELRYRVLRGAMACARETCSNEIQAGGYVWRNKSNADFFCSTDCRFNEGCRQRQADRYRTNAEHRDYERAYKLRVKYGISVEEWDDLYDAQLGRCAICLTTLAEVKTCVDHDHATGEVRGLLCSPCNTGIGLLADDPEVLERAAQYLLQARDRG